MKSEPLPESCEKNAKNIKKLLTTVEPDDTIYRLSRATGNQISRSAKNKSKKFLTKANNFGIIQKLPRETAGTENLDN